MMTNADYPNGGGSASGLEGKERSIIATLLTEFPSELPDVLKNLLRHAPESFDDLRLGTIAVAIRELALQTKPVHVLTVRQWLNSKGKIDDAGGPLFLNQLATDCIPISLAEFEAQAIWDGYSKRRLKSILADALACAEKNPEQTAAIAGGVVAALSDVDTERTHLELPAPLTWAELRQPVDFTGNLLGDRFLERGQGLILYGPSGCGKSVAGLQAVVEWAAGLNGLHITPAAPLRTVVLQTEDSLNDTRESLAGILASTVFTPERLALVERNLIILPPVPGGTSHDLAALLNAAAIAHTPDLIHLNPLLAYCPGDPTRDLGGLLYQTVDPILKRHSVGFVGIHHTPKTNNRDTSGYGAHDHQYLAAGDARVANWPRAMIQIEPVAKGVYRFRLAKRGHRAGWTWDSEPTTERYFKHATGEVRWLDATPEDAEAAEAVESYRTIATVLPGAGEQGISRERVRQLAKDRLHIGKVKADEWLKLGIEDKIIERVENIGDNKRLVALFRQSGGSV